MSITTTRDREQVVPSILLVDDEEDILPEYQEFLELEGFASITCSDPEQAVAMVLDRPDVRLVITDLRMAKLDGANLIRRLRSILPAGRQVGFIILTGDATTQIGEEIGDIKVFIKPADNDALVAEIKSALARNG